VEFTLANTKQAKKRSRQAEKHRVHNTSRRSEMRTYLKDVVKSIADGNLVQAQELYRKASSMVDKLANKGLIHKNKASRHKSRLCIHIRKAGGVV
jgi:small subunit ribosomal protein S20